MNMQLKKIPLCRHIATLFALCMASSVIACQVPVFRYALERWNPDRYRVLVLSPGPLESSLQQSFGQSTNVTSKVNVEAIDVSQTESVQIKELWRLYGGKGPVAVALYPEKSNLRNQVAHTCPLTEANLQCIISSPTRKEIARRLADGHSAVWVLLESNDAAKNQAALSALEQQLALDQQWLKLPTPEEMEITSEVLDQLKIKLRMQFSVLTVRRDDVEEQFLIDCLLNSEPDLRETDEPLAFPIFGRGIVLYALVGKGIASDTIRTASSFICGPCSCQVKEQNPGFDLLLDNDWDAAVGDTFVSQVLPGTGAAPRLLTIPPGRQKTAKP